MQLEEKISALISDSLHTVGYNIVRVRLINEQPKILQIMIDRLDEVDITIKDCTKASRLISAIIDVEDPIEGEYNLEVSSPGIDRPLVRERDFERFTGYEIKFSTHLPIEGRKRFTGRLKGISEGVVQLLLVDDTLINVELGNILNAKLVMNDELIAGAANKN